MSRVPWKSTVLFLYIWLMVGFATGTLVLLGPARWLTATLRDAGWSQTREDLVMTAVIGAFVLLSAALAFAIARWVGSPGRSRTARWLAPAGLTLLAGLALWGWMTPGVFASAGEDTIERVRTGSGAEFVFGAYPDIERLRELQEDGVDGVISLQHPAVVPFEPDGIAKSKRWTSELGLEFVHAPMLPWISDNAGALAAIREVVRRGEGTWYVHCGLGRDRVNVVRRMIERMGGRTVGSEVQNPRTWADRRADGKEMMERGRLREIGPDVWLIPYPNEHELFGNMLAGQVAHVLLLLDPEDDEQGGWIRESTGLFDQHAVPWSLEPLPTTPIPGAAPDDGARAREIARRAADLPRPLTVVAPWTEPRGNPAVAEAFLEAWREVSARPAPDRGTAGPAAGRARPPG